MSSRPIIDAGPSLNFLSINKERLLIGVLGKLSTPETVEAEVLRKAHADRRFKAVTATWGKLTRSCIQVLSDDLTPELAAVISRIAEMPAEQRLKTPKDLGELMVVAHAVVAAERGDVVTVLIDDGAGARLAAAEKRRLDRSRRAGRQVGGISLVSTLTVLEGAAKTEHLPDRGAMRETYLRLRGLDDGLPPIERTRLLEPALWT
ncbi:MULTISPECIES: hypothetical protein [Actinosynnema]|uniref:hypothetical protein n=1 Tax=Actinosynnema TaxID=40566 RepID=UPI0020A2FB81|nr:hypothetical protein [Actinosynnema pretiosum]MCP2092826.1 hypothetical protein [Actinosynnema pretiosum]